MKIIAFHILVLSILMHASVSAQTVFPFQNIALTDNARLDYLLSLMTIDEKLNSL